MENYPLEITHLSVRKFTPEDSEISGGSSFPYMVVNSTFKVDRNSQEGKSLWEMCFKDSQEYSRILAYSDWEKSQEWYADCFLNGSYTFNRVCPYAQMVDIPQDPVWRYIKKFDTFWFREWVALSTVTKALVDELSSYVKHGNLRSKASYRTSEDYVALNHLRTLHSYWD